MKLNMDNVLQNEEEWISNMSSTDVNLFLIINWQEGKSVNV